MLDQSLSVVMKRAAAQQQQTQQQQSRATKRDNQSGAYTIRDQQAMAQQPQL